MDGIEKILKSVDLMNSKGLNNLSFPTRFLTTLSRNLDVILDIETFVTIVGLL